MTKIDLKGLEKMARDLVKDPATRKALESQFRKIVGRDSSHQHTPEELDELYKEIQEKFKHGYSVGDVGDNDDKA